MLTAEDIARITGTPLRTVQHRLAKWAKRGGPVVRSPRRRQYLVTLEDYARRLCVRVETLRLAV